MQPTRRDLLTLMIIISDNTATDMNCDLLGGMQVIEDAIHALGLTDISLKFNCKDLLKYLFPPEIRDLPIEEIESGRSEITSSSATASSSSARPTTTSARPQR